MRNLNAILHSPNEIADILDNEGGIFEGESAKRLAKQLRELTRSRNAIYNAIVALAEAKEYQ